MNSGKRRISKEGGPGGGGITLYCCQEGKRVKRQKVYSVINERPLIVGDCSTAAYTLTLCDKVVESKDLIDTK